MRAVELAVGADILLIEHYVAPSVVHGLGVFAKNFVPSGTKVWIFHAAIDREIPKADVYNLPAHVISMIENHAEYLPGREMFRLSSDGDFYMNHADDPNIEIRCDEMFARKDIHPGNELFIDYRGIKVLAYDPEIIGTKNPFTKFISL